MKIEKGKTYAISNLYKKTFVEINFYRDETGKMFQREIGWRSGTVYVAPVYDVEVENLQLVLDAGDDYDDELELSGFAEHEFSETSDGCWEDYSTHQEEWKDELESLRESYLDDEEITDEYFDFGSYMEVEHGFDMDDTEMYITGPISVEETDYQIDVDMEMYIE